MDNFGLMSLLNSGKISKNNSKNSNSILKSAGKNIINSKNKLNFSKVMEESSVLTSDNKTEIKSDCEIKKLKTNLLNVKTAVIKNGEKESISELTVNDIKSKNLKSEELNVNSILDAEVTTDIKNEKKTGKIKVETAVSEEKVEKKTDEKEKKIESKILANDYTQGYNNVLLLSEIKSDIKTEYKNIEKNVGTKVEDGVKTKENLFNLKEFQSTKEGKESKKEMFTDKNTIKSEESSELKITEEITDKNLLGKLKEKLGTEEIKIERNNTKIESAIEGKTLFAEKINIKSEQKIENSIAEKKVEIKSDMKIEEAQSKIENGVRNKQESNLKEVKLKDDSTVEKIITAKDETTKKEEINLSEKMNGIEKTGIEVVVKNEKSGSEKTKISEEVKIKKNEEVITKSESSKEKIEMVLVQENKILKEESKELEIAKNSEVKSDKSEEKKWENEIVKTETKDKIENKNVILAENSAELSNRIDIRPVETKVYSKSDLENSYNQIENMIKMSFNADTKEMKLRLSPDDLGEVEVKISIENSIMKAEFLVENEKVKEMLESRFADLKTALSEKGIETSGINVNISGGESQSRGYAQKAFYEELIESNGIAVDNKMNTNYVAAVEKNSAGYNTNLNGSLNIIY